MNNIKLELMGPEEFGMASEAYGPEEYMQKYSASIWLGLILGHGNRLTNGELRTLNVEKYYLGGGYYRVLVFSAHCIGDPAEPGIRFPKERQYAYYVAGNVLTAVLASSYMSYFGELNGRFVALLSFIQPDPEDVLGDIAASIASDLRYAAEYCRGRHGVAISYSESAFYEGPANIPAAYRQAQAEEEYALFSNEPRHDESFNADVGPGRYIQELTRLRELSEDLFNAAADARPGAAGDAADRTAEYIMNTAPYSVANAMRRLEYMLYVLLDLADGAAGGRADAGERRLLIDTLSSIKNENGLRACIGGIADELMQRFERGRSQDAVANAERIKTYVLENYADSSLTVAVVAEVLNLNVNTLSAQFMKLCGMSIADFIHRTRLERAVELLRGSELGLAEVCGQAGFGSINTMYRSFKKYLHASPANFRRGAVR